MPQVKKCHIAKCRRKVVGDHNGNPCCKLHLELAVASSEPPTVDVPRVASPGTITIPEPQGRPVHWTDGMKAEQREREQEQTKYVCLSCRLVRFADDPKELPRGDHRCSHEWEPERKPAAAVGNVLGRKLQQSRADQASGPPHLMITARAGTGKTTTLVGAMKVLRGMSPGLTPSEEQRAVWDEVGKSKDRCRFMCFAAFNSSIAKELRERVPRDVDAKTFHSAGYAAVRKAFQLPDTAVDDGEDRIPNIVQELTNRDIRELRKERPTLVPTIEKVVDLCKGNLVGWKQPGVSWEQQLDDLCYKYEIDTEGVWGDVVSLVPRVLERCLDVNRDRCLTFTDMIWLPVVLDLPMFKFDVLFVDEAQDLNRCQHELVKKMGRRIVMCGDPAQSIYGFSGADSEGIPNILEYLRSQPQGCTELGLTVTRRCGKSIVREVLDVVPDFKAHESNPEGVVRTMKYPLQPGPDRSVKELPVEHTYLPSVRRGDMIVCRSVAPLVSQYFKLFKMGIPASIQGKDLAQQIINLIAGRKASSVPDLIAKLDDWYAAEVAKEQAKRNPRESVLESLRDRHTCAKFFTQDAATVPDVIRTIESVFTKDDKSDPSPAGKVRLMSIHKAKGLESGRVFYLQPAVFPGRRPDRLPAWQRTEEQNLRYVAKTRAIEELVYVV